MRPNHGNPMMGQLPMGQLVAKMSIPLMISMLIQSLYNLVDSFFVAKLGMEAISAVGISFPFHMLIISVANGLGVGMSALIAQRFGRGEGDKAPRAVGCAFLLYLLLAAGFLAFGLWGSAAYFRLSTDDPLIAAYGADYLSVICIGSVAHLLALFNERLLQVTGRATLSMITQSVGAVLNIVLDPILIFGLLGAPELGVRGAALATIIGLAVATLVGFVLNLRYNPQLRPTLSQLRLGEEVREIVKVGVPVALTMATSALMTLCINQILKAYVTAIAVFTIYYRLQTFLFMPTAGMMQGLIPIVGYNFGAKNGARLRQAMGIAVKTAVIITVTGLVLLELFPGAIFGLFADQENPAMLVMGIRALRIIALTFPISGVAMVCSNVFQGMGNGTLSLVYGLGRQCVLLLPAAWLLLRFAGVDGVWWAFVLAEYITAAVVLLLFRRAYRNMVEPLLGEKPEEA